MGTTAQLYCQADADAVFWRVNGSSLNQLNVRGIREGTTTIQDGPPLHTLYVEATQELNNIIIACIAVHFDLNINNTLSEPALLRVQGNDLCGCCITPSHHIWYCICTAENFMGGLLCNFIYGLQHTEYSDCNGTTNLWVTKLMYQTGSLSV